MSNKYEMFGPEMVKILERADIIIEKERLRKEGKEEPPKDDKPIDEPQPESYRKPFLDPDGTLVIPHDCDPKYRWWQSGQSVEKTLEELKAEDLIN